MKEVRLEIKLMDSHDKDNLFDIYDRLQEERRLNIFLYSDNSLQNFFNLFHNQWVYIPIVDGEEAGFTAFNDFMGKNAFFHFCMWRGYEEFTVDLGKMIFETVFASDGLENILGLTPEIYRHVFPVLHGVGMKEIYTLEKACFVHGKYRNGVVSKINKNYFLSEVL